MSVPVYPRSNVWEPGILNDQESVQDIRRQMLELRETLREIQDQLEYGPIRGTYYPLTWFIGSVVAGALTAVGQGLLPFHGSARPVSVWYVCNSGSLTFDINNASGTILSAALSATTTPAAIKDRTDFAVDEIGEPRSSSYLQIFIDSIDSGTPTVLGVTLLLKSLDKVDYL